MTSPRNLKSSVWHLLLFHYWNVVFVILLLFKKIVTCCMCILKQIGYDTEAFSSLSFILFYFFFFEFYKKGVKLHVIFCTSSLSCSWNSFMLWNHFSSLIFTAPWSTLLEIYHSLFIHSLVHKHFRLFHFCYYKQFHSQWICMCLQVHRSKSFSGICSSEWNLVYKLFFFFFNLILERLYQLISH